MFGIFVHYSTRPIYDVGMNLFCGSPSVDIFNILPGFLWQPFLAQWPVWNFSFAAAIKQWTAPELTKMRSGAVVRALASRPTNVVWVRILAWRHTCMWVEFVVGSRPCSERVFFVYFGFPSPQKYTLPNSISIWNARTLFDDFLRTPKCSVGKEMSSYNFFYRCLIWTRARP